MKSILRIVLFIALFSILNQDSYSQKSTMLGALYSIPVGDFGNNSIEEGGFAKPGFGIVFDSKSPLAKQVSFISHSTYSWIDIDGAAMEVEFSKYLGAKTQIEKGQYRPFFSTFGLGYDFDVSEKFKVGLTGQIGVLYNSFVPIKMSVYDTNDSLIFKDLLEYDSDFAFAYLFGVNASYFIIPKVLAIQLSADYSTGKIDTYLRSQNFDPIPSVNKIEFLNIGLGIAFFN